MSSVPKGYVALTASHDGSRFLIDARGLAVSPAKPAHRAGGKLPDGCVVGPINAAENYWIVAESFDEVCAKLVEALGAPESDTAANVVKAAVKWRGGEIHYGGLVDAIEAHRAAKGGAT